MSRIKAILVALMAVMAIGFVGASTASADGDATLEVVGLGACDVEYASDSPWIPTDPGDPHHPGWKTPIYDVAPAAGGDCGVDRIDGEGWLYKNSAGQMTFVGNFSFRVLFGLIGCSYVTTPPTHVTGTYTVSGGQKHFAMSGGVTKTSGPNPPCPATATVNMNGSVDA